MSGRFVLKHSGSQYYFILQASGNYETLLSSERYLQKSSAENGISSVKTNSQFDSRYEKKTSTKNEPYFVLKGSNGEVIGTSEMYSSTTARDNGMAAVKSNASGATTIDET